MQSENFYYTWGWPALAVVIATAAGPSSVSFAAEPSYPGIVLAQTDDAAEEPPAEETTTDEADVEADADADADADEAEAEASVSGDYKEDDDFVPTQEVSSDQSLRYPIDI